ncbi:MAG: hypothetical protein M3Y21_00575 [Candidatus Eremiobacteraeota bacterium]|nr:hypothetical protein [Candidatus Eremiobacteraeota bacterium]
MVRPRNLGNSEGMNLITKARYGALAGAAGTAALNTTAYIDMAVRGRQPSELPEKVVRKLAEMAGLSMLSKPPEQLNDHEKHQRAGVAALIGYVDGIGAGMFFGLLRPSMRGIPPVLCGILLGAFTMALSEGTAAALGQTNPAEWPPDAWVSDIVPRCIYGWVACAAFDAMVNANDRR